MKHGIAQMLKQERGTIVNASFIYGVVGAEGFSACVASKSAIAALTKIAAPEYVESGIRSRCG